MSFDPLSPLDWLGGLGTVVDTPWAMGRAALAGKNPLPGVFDPEQRTSGRDMLEAWGAVSPNEEGLDAGDVAGFGVEMLDPISWAAGLWISKALKTMKAAKIANAESMALRASGAMPEEIAKLTKVVDESGKPLKVFHGTPKAFDKFDVNAIKDPDQLLYGKGIYTTDNPIIAETYAAKFPGRSYQPNQYTYESIADHILHGPYGNMYDKGTLKALTDVFEGNEAAKNVDFAKLIEQPYSHGSHADLKKAVLENVRESFHPDRYEQTLKRIKEANKTHGTYYSPKNSIDSAMFPTPSNANVRMHYMDSRNPFDVSAFLDDEKALEKLKSYHLPDRKMYYPGYDAAEDYMYGPYGHSYGPSMTKDAYWKELKKFTEDPNSVLQELGYDSIQHPGGLVHDTAKHNVNIAFSPEQMYAPYVAQAMQKVPNAMRTVVPLAAYLGLRPMHDLQ